MSDSLDSRFAPPLAHVEDLAAGEGDPLASRWMRLVAAVIDSLIWGGVFWVLLKVPGVEDFVYAGHGPSAPGTWIPMGAICGFVLFVLIQGWPLIQRGQTLGKMVCKLRIVRSDGSKVDAARLLGLRYGAGYLCNSVPLLSAIYGLLDGLLIFRASRKCLHDTIADTKVIKL